MHVYFILCGGVLLTCVSASCVLPGTQEMKRECEILGLELSMVVSHLVDAWN